MASLKPQEDQENKKANDQVFGDKYDWLFLALAHARLNHPAEARKWLALAEKDIAEKEKAKPKPGWVDRLQYRLLTKEIKGLIGAKASRRRSERRSDTIPAGA